MIDKGKYLYPEQSWCRFICHKFYNPIDLIVVKYNLFDNSSINLRVLLYYQTPAVY